MTWRMRVSLWVLFVAVQCVWVTGSIALEPLPSHERAAFESIPPDPKPKALTKNIHFWVSDERHHYHFREHIAARGGVYVGIGTQQNFMMAAWQRAALIVILDFDQVVVDLHDVYREAFLEAETPAAFLDLWSSRGSARLKTRLRDRFEGESPDPARLKRALWALKHGRRRVIKRLKENKALYRAKGKQMFLISPEDYDYLRAMYKAGRVVVLRGDLTAKQTLASLGEVLKAQGRVIEVLYMSNTEQYFPYTSQFRTNMLGLPVSDDAHVVRTRAWRTRPAEGQEKGTLYYAYLVQSFSLWAQWLRYEPTTDVRQMLPWASRVKNRRYVLEGLPGAKKK